MAKNQSLAQFFASRGMKLKTWARAKKLNSKDILLIYQISYGFTQGVRGRAKELKELLEKEGFGRALEKSVASKGFVSCRMGCRSDEIVDKGVDFTHPQTPSAREGAFARNDEKSGILPCGDDKKGA